MKRFCLAALALCCTVVPGCAQRSDSPPPAAPARAPAPAAESQSGAGLPRALHHRLQIPARPATSAALVVMLHGCLQDPASFARGIQMTRLASRHGFYVLYPEQPKSANDKQCWNWHLPENQKRAEGEVASIVALVEKTIERHGIDRSRVFVAGMSAGGAMAAILTACHPDLFAAAAIHSGVGYGVATDLESAVAAMAGRSVTPLSETAHALAICPPEEKRPTPPVLVIHGTEDPVTVPAAGRAIPRQFVMAYSERLGLAVPAADTIEPAASEPRPRSGARAQRWERYEIGGRARVEAVWIEGLGHAWSGGREGVPFNDPMPPASSALIWNFFVEATSGEGRQ